MLPIFNKGLQTERFLYVKIEKYYPAGIRYAKMGISANSEIMDVLGIE
jgi:hypothetical protein